MHLGVVDQTMMNGVKREFEAVGDTEFVKNVVKVVLDGLLGDEEFFANFFVAEALSDELDNFFLAVTEQRLFAARPSFGRFRERLHDFRGHAIVEPDFAGMHAMNAFNQEIRSGLLQYYAASAQPHGANHVAIVFGSREHHNTRGQRVEIHFLEDGKPVLIGHAQIEQQNVRLQLGEQLDILLLDLRFAHNGNYLVGVQEFTQAIAEDGVVIG